MNDAESSHVHSSTSPTQQGLNGGSPFHLMRSRRDTVHSRRALHLQQRCSEILCCSTPKQTTPPYPPRLLCLVCGVESSSGTQGSSVSLEFWSHSSGLLGRDAPMEGQPKSSLMSSLTDAAEAKRRCIVVGSASGVQQTVTRKSRCRFVVSDWEKLRTLTHHEHVLVLGGVEWFGSSPHAR